jgi:hypothetical protein
MDRTTKILLAAIALGLWANAVMSVIRPAAAQVDGLTLSNISGELSSIAKDFKDIASGYCNNRKLCGP